VFIHLLDNNSYTSGISKSENCLSHYLLKPIVFIVLLRQLNCLWTLQVVQVVLDFVKTGFVVAVVVVVAVAAG
jgi:hypothetical protein